ncbi:hypothetical protein ACO0R3_000571 [Hanseniaspora guilliermondii]
MYLYNWKELLEYYELPHSSNALNINKINNDIKDIHIYDFDGTMFYSPSISADIFTSRAKDYLIPFKGMKNSGGWWCYQYSLETYINNWINEKNEASTTNNPKDRCYCDQCKIDHKYWSYDIIMKIHDSYKQENCLTVIMTGRREDRFKDTFKRLLKGDIKNRTIFHKELKFDCVFLKKDYKYTMQYKLNVITNFLKHFKKLKSIKMYDDRADQIVGMRSWWKKQRNYRIKYKVIAVIPKVGKYDNNQQLKVIQDLINTHNKNTPEQVLNINLSIYEYKYYAIDKGITRFLEMFLNLEFNAWNYEKGILGIQLLNNAPINDEVEWVIKKFKISQGIGCFLELHNKQDVNQKAVIITHYKESHLNTYKQIIKHDILNNYDKEIDVLYDTKRQLEYIMEINDEVKVKETIHLNNELKLTFLSLDKTVLSFMANMTKVNDFMMIDLYE